MQNFPSFSQSSPVQSSRTLSRCRLSPLPIMKDFRIYHWVQHTSIVGFAWSSIKFSCVVKFKSSKVEEFLCGVGILEFCRLVIELIAYLANEAPKLALPEEMHRTALDDTLKINQFRDSIRFELLQQTTTIFEDLKIFQDGECTIYWRLEYAHINFESRFSVGLVSAAQATSKLFLPLRLQRFILHLHSQDLQANFTKV